jgi:hypothetical protein
MIIDSNSNIASALRWLGYLKQDSENRWWQAGQKEGGGVKYKTSGKRLRHILGGSAKVGGKYK